VPKLSDSIFRLRATRLAIGIVALALGIVLPGTDAARLAVILLGTWLVVGTVIGRVASRHTVAREVLRSIPIGFSGTLGRFQLRPRGDGRRVEVSSGDSIVAELIARDEGDELIVDFSLADEPDVDAFGAAIGLAIEMVAAADQEGDRGRPARPATPSRKAGYRPLRPFGRA
jgi:hypothetical protein